MVLTEICRHHSAICKGRCCEDTVVYCDWAGSRLPAEIKRQLPQVNLIKPSHTSSDGKSHHGWTFSCNWFIKETHSCKDFKNRPYMCRTYICEDAVNILALTQEPNEDLPW